MNDDVATTDPVAADPGPPVPLDLGPFPPLSLAQERVWFYDLLAPDAPFHNVPRLIAISGPLQPELLERAMSRIVERHHVLRCTFHLRDGVMVQQLNPPVPVQVPIIDLRALDPDAAGAELDRLCAELVVMPFDIGTSPLMRGHLIRTADEHHVFLLDFHHIACDGWSERVTLNEIAALYEAYRDGKPDPLPELRLQYFDFAVWQRRRLASSAVEAHHDYWRARLGDEIPRLELPTDRPIPLRRRYQGASMGYELDAPLADALRRLAREHNATLYMVALTTFVILLHRYTGQDAIAIGSPINNREREEFHDLIGYFVTRLPLYVDVSGDPTVVELLGRVRRTVLEGFAHKETTAERWPFPRAGEEVRDSSNYQVMFLFQENPVGVERRFADLVVTNANASSQQRVATMGLRSPTLGSQLDLGCFMEPVGDRVFGWMEYATDAFDPATIAGMRDHLLGLLAAVVRDPHATVSSLDLVGSAEARGLAPGLPTAVDGYDDLVLPDLFAAVAARHPDRVAVSDADVEWTFGEVDRRANALAHRLRDTVEPGRLVAVVLPRSARLLAAVIGVLRAGYPVICMDPHLPDDRLRSTLRLAEADAIVADAGDHERHADMARVVVAPPATQAAQAPAHGLTGGDLAFVFATSGTTGEPKLVEVEHRQAAVGQLPDFAPYPLTEADALLFTTPPGSARLLGEIFWPLLSGARVAVAPDGALTPSQWREALTRSGATVVSIIPSMLAAVLEDRPDELAAASRLRLLQVLGEPLTGWLARRAKAALPGVTLVNSYAQTEACPALFGSERLDSSETSAPVRRDSALSIAYVLDANRRPLPYNVVGDVYIGGYTVVRGYRRAQEATAESFVPDPFAARAGARMFRTGDRGRLRRDGTLEVLGRTDNRVKIQGHSVALEEVESVLAAASGVAEAQCFTERGPTGDLRLFAAVVPDAGTPLDVHALRADLAARLAGHQVPFRIGLAESLPRTAAGKLDRTAPPRVSYAAEPETPVPPRTETEQRILDLWRDVLGRPELGVNHGFFDSGGTSLDGIRLVSRISRAFGLELDLRLLVEQRTVAGMSARVDEMIDAAGRA